MNEDFKTLFEKSCYELAKLDVKRIVKQLQKWNLWEGYDYKNNYPISSLHIKSYVENNISTLTKKQYNIYLFELNNLIENFNDTSDKKITRSFHRLIIEKEIQDYEIEIQKLQNQTINFKEAVQKIDPDQNIRKFEAYTAEWAAAQDKIEFLTKEKNTLKRKLLPPSSFHILT